MSGPTPSVQFSWDGPGALGAGDDGWRRLLLGAALALTYMHIIHRWPW